ncbi:hypothetical protein EV182_001408 [Spiromyces aspiralis]|uniref:Uncharacterized protein n=1 Tax=Spiromyces aspiralis TaxID=68401 RepID=A0ACC1HFX8_9FUNG|nr:hypothetical protein EV182_001408 [Spiromyces aspiralis]
MPPLPFTHTYRAPIKHRIFTLGVKRHIHEDPLGHVLSWMPKVDPDGQLHRRIYKIGYIRHIDEIWMAPRSNMPWDKCSTSHTFIFIANGSARFYSQGSTHHRYALSKGDLLYLPPCFSGYCSFYTESSPPRGNTHFLVIEVEPPAAHALLNRTNLIWHYSTHPKRLRTNLLCPLLIPSWSPPPPLFHTIPFDPTLQASKGDSGLAPPSKLSSTGAATAAINAINARIAANSSRNYFTIIHPGSEQGQGRWGDREMGAAVYPPPPSGASSSSSRPNSRSWSLQDNAPAPLGFVQLGIDVYVFMLTICPGQTYMYYAQRPPRDHHLSVSETSSAEPSSGSSSLQPRRQPIGMQGRDTATALNAAKSGSVYGGPLYHMTDPNEAPGHQPLTSFASSPACSNERRIFVQVLHFDEMYFDVTTPKGGLYVNDDPTLSLINGDAGEFRLHGGMAISFRNSGTRVLDVLICDSPKCSDDGHTTGSSSEATNYRVEGATSPQTDQQHLTYDPYGKECPRHYSQHRYYNQ